MLTKKQLIERQSGIGGSEAAQVMNCSKFGSQLSVYLRKIGEEQDISDKQKHFFKIRSLLEPVVVKLYEEDKNCKCIVDKTTYRHKKYNWMLANIDRRIKNKNGILECKTVHQFMNEDWGEEGTDEVPADILLQCAHYCCVLDVPWVDIAVLKGGNTYASYIYKRNLELEEKIIKVEYDFWHENVLKKKAPEIFSFKDAKIKFINEDLTEQIADEEDITNINQLNFVKKQIKELKNKEDYLKLKIVCSMKNSSILIDEIGKKLATWKIQHRKAYIREVIASHTRVLRICKIN